MTNSELKLLKQATKENALSTLAEAKRLYAAAPYGPECERARIDYLAALKNCSEIRQAA